MIVKLTPEQQQRLTYVRQRAWVAATRGDARMWSAAIERAWIAQDTRRRLRPSNYGPPMTDGHPSE